MKAMFSVLTVFVITLAVGCNSETVSIADSPTIIEKPADEHSELLELFNSDIQSMVRTVPIIKYETSIAIARTKPTRTAYGFGYASSNAKRMMCSAQYVEDDGKFKLATICVDLEEIVVDAKLTKKYKEISESRSAE